VIKRTTGSHSRLTLVRNDSSYHVTIPLHDVLKKGTLHGIVIPSLNNLSTIILRFWLRLQEKCSAYLDIPHIFLFVSLKILEFFMEELFRDGIKHFEICFGKEEAERCFFC